MSENAQSVEIGAMTPLPEGERMDAYYYGFDRTGVGAIDRLLSVMAYAGKAFHHTESWQDDMDWEYGPIRKGETCADAIQRVANESAEAIRAVAGRPATPEHPHLAAVEAYLNNAGIVPETLRYAATHEALCRSWIFDLLTGLADTLDVPLLRPGGEA